VSRKHRRKNARNVIIKQRQNFKQRVPKPTSQPRKQDITKIKVQQLDMKTLNMRIALVGLKHSFPAIVSQFGQGTRFGFLQ
jgi:hypothetical protein